MLITQTPLRVSLLGGGTDFREYFCEWGGAVLSLAIDKYVCVIVKERFDSLIYINYSRKEIVESVDEIRHDLVREAMRITGVDRAVEITTLADVPSEGSGLGSSSSITVGLLNALYAYQGRQVTAEQVAREACQIEIDVLRRPMGVQDQYIAAYGNLCFFEFRTDGRVGVDRAALSEGQKRKLVSDLLLFYTGRTRKSSVILKEQRENIPAKSEQLKCILALAYQAREELERGSLEAIGHLLHQNWEAKKTLASGFSLPEIDKMYQRARAAGAIGGKVCTR